MAFMVFSHLGEFHAPFYRLIVYIACITLCPYSCYDSHRFINVVKSRLKIKVSFALCKLWSGKDLIQTACVCTNNYYLVSERFSGMNANRWFKMY